MGIFDKALRFSSCKIVMANVALNSGSSNDKNDLRASMYSICEPMAYLCDLKQMIPLKEYNKQTKKQPIPRLIRVVLVWRPIKAQLIVRGVALELGVKRIVIIGQECALGRHAWQVDSEKTCLVVVGPGKVCDCPKWIGHDFERVIFDVEIFHVEHKFVRVRNASIRF